LLRFPKKGLVLNETNRTKRWDIYPRIDLVTSAVLEPYPAFMRQILFNRGIRTLEEADRFLSADTDSGDPFLLLDMEKAVDRLLTAVKSNEPIIVYGDYDVDGVTATVMMVEVLRELGGNVTRYIPNRFEEGYGLNTDAIQVLADSGAKVILTVDCGIRSPVEADLAKSLGIDLIISDHHHPADVVPAAFAVICPKQDDDAYPYKDLAGVGVAFKIVQGLFLRSSLDVRKADEWLDLVALGTVADIVPLTAENRVMVKKGLQRIRLGRRVGLNALVGVAGKDIHRISASDIGYIIGPRLNAAGRMESALEAYNLLINTSIEEAVRFAQVLEDRNTERQKTTRAAQEEVQKRLGDVSDLFVIIDHDPGFSSGIVGLVASKLVDSYYRPAIIGQDEGEMIRASCRSIPELHITEALDECAELMVRHGGHAMAAGFTIEQKNFDTLKMRLQEIARVKLDNVDLRPVIRADLEMDIKGFNPAHFAMLEQLQPTGMGNPAPVFVSRKVDVEGMRLMGKEEDHISFFIRGSKINRAVAFNQAQWYETWKEEKPQFDIAYTIDVNHYNGLESLQLRVLDMKISGI
jgi:single-stranded-DNA-specific exonuclease